MTEAERSGGIVEVRCALVQTPFPGTFSAGNWIFETVHNVVIAVKTADGTWGMGYAFVFDKWAGRSLLVASEAVAERALGANVFDTVTLHDIHDTGMPSVYAGTEGISRSALGALDMAYWDAKSRCLGVSLHALLGASTAKVHAYASGGPTNKSLSELEREVRGYIDEGFDSVKLKVPPDRTSATERMARVREWVGPDVDLMFDANQALTLKEAVVMASCASDLGVYWLEEPLPSWDLSGYSELVSNSHTRIAIGETMYGERAFSTALELRSGDVMMPNLHKVGGISGWLTVRELCRLRGIPMASHIMSEWSAHTLSSVTGPVILEYMELSRPLYSNWVQRDGSYVTPPNTEAGTGLEPSHLVRSALELI